MKLRCQIGLVRRVVTLALLLWAFGDLAVPGWCQTDAGAETPLAVSLAASRSLHDHADGVCRVETQSHDSAPRVDAAQPSSQETGEEDCWCCCSHITPAGNSALVNVDLVDRTVDAAPPRLAGGVTPLLYHPPRA